MIDRERGTGGESLANFLGWFSIGLGLAEVVAPGGMAKLVGVESGDRNRRVVRSLGMREIGHGVSILSNRRPTKAVWSRVAGDAIDLALLGRALANPENSRGRTAVATANVLAVTALDVAVARGLSRQPGRRAKPGLMRTTESITVNHPRGEVYAFWHDFQNLPRFMEHLESVQVIDDRRSHWKAKAPAGQSVEWDAELTEDRPDELIAWRSVEGADVFNTGRVRFMTAPGGRGTELHVEFEYRPPLGKLGAQVAKLFREEPGQQVRDDLRRFKQVMEVGEVLLSDATLRPGPHPAQPPKEPVQTAGA